MCLENVIEESRDCVGWVFLYMSNRNLKERKEKKKQRQANGHHRQKHSLCFCLKRIWLAISVGINSTLKKLSVS